MQELIGIVMAESGFNRAVNYFAYIVDREFEIFQGLPDEACVKVYGTVSRIYGGGAVYCKESRLYGTLLYRQ